MSEASSHKPAPSVPGGSSATGRLPIGDSSSARARFDDDARTVISSRPPLPDLVFRGGVADETLRQWQGEQLGQFLLQEFIGGGGMGIVFRALDTTLDREVAVKVLAANQSADEETLRRFRNEAQSAARLNHDNIAHVFYVGEDRGVHYIVFEFIEGINIRDLVEQHGPLPLAEAVSYTYQVAQALEHASRRAVIHRDIKPSNVLISSDGKAKLVDMGLARLSRLARNDDLTASGVTLGTFDYISPEQARDPRSADVRSDLYSLGCSFFFMLTGRPPFPEGTVLQKLLQHQGDTPPDPRQLRPELPPQVTQVLARLLAKNPTDRYQQPGELIDDLAALGQALGLQLGPAAAAWVKPRRGYRFSQWQHHVPWAASIAALLLSVVALDWYWSLETSATPGAGNLPGETKAALPKAPAPLPPPAELEQPLPEEPADGELRPRPESLGAAPAAPPETDDQPPDPLRVFGKEIWDAVISRPANLRDPPSRPRPPAELPAQNESPAGTIGEQPSAQSSSLPAGTTTGANVLIVSRQPAAGQFGSLQAACSRAKDGDIIELRFDGRLVEPRPIEISNRDLTLQAGRKTQVGGSFAPIVTFRPDADWTSKYPPAMFSVAGGELTLRGLAWELDLPRDDPADWTLFETRRCERLVLDNCTLTVRGQSEFAPRAAFIDVKAAPSTSSMDVAGGDGEEHVVEIQLRNCVARGEAAFLRDNDLQSVQLRWENGLLTTSEHLFVADGAALEPRHDAQASLTLDHVTVMTGAGLVLLTNSQEKPYQLLTDVTCNDCILATPRRAPLVEQRGPDRIDDYQARFTWNGRHNYFDGFDVFWLIMNSTGQSGSLQLGFDDWQRAWGDASQPQSAEPSAVVWNQPVFANRPFHAHTPADYALDPTAAVNQARGGGSNQSDAGGWINYLPRPPDADRFGRLFDLRP